MIDMNICVKVITGKKVIIVIVAYRPPHTGVELMDEINRPINDKLHGSLVIGGDFNLHEVVWDIGTCRSAAQLHYPNRTGNPRSLVALIVDRFSIARNVGLI
jgi:Endonuclease-reverse transcriptase